MSNKVGTIEYKSKKFDVFCQLTGGNSTLFSAIVGKDKLEAQTVEKLEKLIRKHVKTASATVAVPFLQYEVSTDYHNQFPRRADGKDKLEDGEVRFERGIANGLHAANEDVLVTWEESGTKDRLSGYYSKSHLRDLAEDECAKLAALYKTYRFAERAYNECLTEFSINLKERVKDALAEALGDVPEDDRD